MASLSVTYTPQGQPHSATVTIGPVDPNKSVIVRTTGLVNLVCRSMDPSHLHGLGERIYEAYSRVAAPSAALLGDQARDLGGRAADFFVNAFRSCSAEFQGDINCGALDLEAGSLPNIGKELRTAGKEILSFTAKGVEIAKALCAGGAAIASCASGLMNRTNARRMARVLGVGAAATGVGLRVVGYGVGGSGYGLGIASLFCLSALRNRLGLIGRLAGYSVQAVGRTVEKAGSLMNRYPQITGSVVVALAAGKLLSGIVYSGIDLVTPGS